MCAMVFPALGDSPGVSTQVLNDSHTETWAFYLYHPKIGKSFEYGERQACVNQQIYIAQFGVNNLRTYEFKVIVIKCSYCWW